MKRIARLLGPQDLGANGVETIDINLNEQISQFAIRMTMTNVTVSVMLATLQETISRVEIVDGSEVLFSMNGNEIQAMHYYNTGKMPYNHIGLTVGNICEFTLPIMFGRYLWDPLFALRPERYRNLQMKIHWDEDASNTAVDVNSCTVWAYVDDNPPGGGSRGFLRSVEQKSYAMNGAVHEYSTLPNDHPIRMLMVRGFSNDHSPEDLIDTIRFEIGNGAYVPVEETAESIVRMLSQEYERITMDDCMDQAITAKQWFTNVASDVNVTVIVDDTAVTAAGEMPNPVITGHEINTAASVAVVATRALTSGRSPHGCIVLPVSRFDNPEEWFDKNVGSAARLDILGLAASDAADTVQICVQQPIPY